MCKGDTMNTQKLYALRLEYESIRKSDNVNLNRMKEMEMIVNPKNLPIIVCTGCGEEFYSNNEDDYIYGVCTMCQEFGCEYAIDRGNDDFSDYCDCEDYPCCGH